MGKIIIGIIIGIVASHIYGRVRDKKAGNGITKEKILEVLIFWFRNMMKNLDDIIMILSVIIFVACQIYDSKSGTDKVSITYLGIFSTLIFSWLLTKKASKIEYEAEQEKLARLSYRQLGDIEKETLAAEQKIKDFAVDEKFMENEEVKHILFSINDNVRTIKNGLDTNKKAWYDMLSEEFRNELAANEKKITEDKTSVIERMNELDLKDFFDFGDLDESCEKEIVANTQVK